MVAVKLLLTIKNPFWFCNQSEAVAPDVAHRCLQCLTENPEPPNKCLQYADPIEAEMHVKIDNSSGPWHRLTIDGARTPGSVLEPHQGPQTACGKRITGYYGTRNETYDGKLCEDGCFTGHELFLARARREEREADERRLADERPSLGAEIIADRNDLDATKR